MTFLESKDFDIVTRPLLMGCTTVPGSYKCTLDKIKDEVGKVTWMFSISPDHYVIFDGFDLWHNGVFLAHKRFQHEQVFNKDDLMRVNYTLNYDHEQWVKWLGEKR